VSRDAVRRVVEAQELERRRLARELHDETGQALASILLGLKPLERSAETAATRAEVAAVRQLVVSTLQDVRALAVELRPAALDDFGLVPAVERLAGTVREQSELRIDFEAQLGGDRLPTEVETALYRVVQEALTNILKHAAARHVSILLARKDGAVVAVIEDDGAGFDPGRTRDDALGLSGMRERMVLVGGRLRVESASGAGTTLVAEVPVR
jgi:signal transduction histidine kinase